MRFRYGAGGYLRFPLLRPGEPITTDEKITKVEHFEPFFSPNRPVVNPAPPIVRDRTIFLREPGEYYLRLNDHTPLRVAVFSPDEGITKSVLRLFDFMVANQLYARAQDRSWYAHRQRFLQRFFVDERPLILSCGPTHQVFRSLIEERFCLPTRIASSATTFYLADGMARLAHNVPEVYLPEFGKFVMFDLNSGYVAKWMDSIDVAEATRVWGDVASDLERASDLVDVHAEVDTCPSTPQIEAAVVQTDDWGTIEFSGNYVANNPMDDFSRARALRTWYSGPIYYGSRAHNVRPTGTEFLEKGILLFANLHTDPILFEESCDWLVREGGTPREEIEIVRPNDLRARLAVGHRKQIDANEWRGRFPL